MVLWVLLFITFSVVEVVVLVSYRLTAQGREAQAVWWSRQSFAIKAFFVGIGLYGLYAAGKATNRHYGYSKHYSTTRRLKRP